MTLYIQYNVVTLNTTSYIQYTFILFIENLLIVMAKCLNVLMLSETAESCTQISVVLESQHIWTAIYPNKVATNSIKVLDCSENIR